MLFLATNINLLIASEARVRLKGPFMVCSEAHFVHASCFALVYSKNHKQECPECRDSALVKVVDAVFKKYRSEGDICSICLEDYAYNPAMGKNRLKSSKD